MPRMRRMTRSTLFPYTTLFRSRVAAIQDAADGDVTILANPKYEKLLASTRASAVILRDDAPAAPCAMLRTRDPRSEEHTSELQSQSNLVCRLLLEKKNEIHSQP